jgi:UDP-N-acetylmuramoyl-L-alanyl-D-glutamate--2,6-diaminopimelate ligase
VKLARLLSGLHEKQVFGDQDLEITGLAYDSRKVRPGFLFVAIKGYRHDGRSFIPDAISNGAVAIVLPARHWPEPQAMAGPVDTKFINGAGEEGDISVEEGIVRIVVPNSRAALAVLANEFYGYPSRELRMVGITGTNGKTTTAYLVEGVLDQAGFKVGLMGTIEHRMAQSRQPAQITTPESLDLQDMLARIVQKGFDYAVMEVSSHSLVLHRVDLVEFDVGVFTNLSPEHLDFHVHLSNYLQSKAELFLQLGEGAGRQGRASLAPLRGRSGASAGKASHPVALINADDRYSQYIMAHTPAKVITYGIKPGADIRAYNIGSTLNGVSFSLQSPAGQCDIRLKLIGDYNVYNALAAVGVGLSQGIGLKEIREGLKNVSTIPGRFELIDEGQDFLVVIDYAHTEGALQEVLKAARRLTTGRIISVFGCGGDRDKSKRHRMGEISGRYSDYTVLTSDNPRSEEPLGIISQIELGLKRNQGDYRVIQDRYQAISQALSLARAGDLVIVAGKGHESCQIFKDKTIPFDDRQAVREILKTFCKGRA